MDRSIADSLARKLSEDRLAIKYGLDKMAIHQCQKCDDSDNVAAVGPTGNPLGVLQYSKLSESSGFKQFHSEFGVGGLAQSRHGQTDILAVHTDQPGTGQLSRFLDALEPIAGTVTFWTMMSGHLAAILKKRGYEKVEIADTYGEKQSCMQKSLWKVEKATKPEGNQDAGI